MYLIDSNAAVHFVDSDNIYHLLLIITAMQRRIKFYVEGTKVSSMCRNLTRITPSPDRGEVEEM